MEWVGDVLAVAVGVWLAGVFVMVSAAAFWGVIRRRRRRVGGSLVETLRMRGVIGDD